MRLNRRALLTASLLLARPRPARAQAWPIKPIRVIVPFAAGGAADSSARTIFPRLGERLGATFVVENRTGASGSIGGAAVAQSAADGHTLLYDASSHIVNPSLLRNLPFDYATAFTPISLVATFPQVISVKADFPARTIGELLEAARRRPGEITIGTQGNATAGHLALAQLERSAGVKFTHVSYRGGAAAARDLAGGTLDGTLITVLSTRPVVEAGRARMLALTILQRLPAFPDVPTLAESGYPGFNVSEWVGLFAPAGTPAAIVERLHGELAKVLGEEPIRARLDQLGAVPVGSAPSDFVSFVREGRDAMAVLVREANITAD